jgi:O-antigen/teichoic acid export membrane protein
MAIPSIALQTAFAHQTASAITPEQQDRLTGTVQTLLSWTFFLWLAMALIIFIFQRQIMTGLKMDKSILLWVTLIIGLAQLWGPILLGVLQGQHNFLWLGWVVILNGVGRFIAIGIFVALLGGHVVGAMTGVLFGIGIATVIAMFQSRSVWWRPKPNFVFDWKSWLSNIVPLTIGLGASQFIFSADVIFVRTILGDNHTGFYVAAGTIGRGIVVFTAPLITVMFPKIVRDLSHGKKTNILAYTVAATAGLCSFAAACCTLLAIFLKHIARSPEIVKNYFPASLYEKLQTHTEAVQVVGQLLPWFVWSMVPLALANVLLNNLLARKHFRVVPYLLIVVAGYLATLTMVGTSFVRVIQILGIFNLLFFVVIAVFTWGPRFKNNSEATLIESPNL